MTPEYSLYDYSLKLKEKQRVHCAWVGQSPGLAQCLFSISSLLLANTCHIRSTKTMTEVRQSLLILYNSWNKLQQSQRYNVNSLKTTLHHLHIQIQFSIHIHSVVYVSHINSITRQKPCRSPQTQVLHPKHTLILHQYLSVCLFKALITILQTSWGDREVVKAEADCVG